MSDYAHSGRRSRALIESKSIESRVLFVACWVLFLARAVISRLVPWRTQSVFKRSDRRESIFSEARTAASVCVTSSFIGL